MGKKSDLSPECQKFGRTDGSSIKYIYSHPKNDNKIGPKYKISSECCLSQNNMKHAITLLKYPTWGGILPENNTDVHNDHE
jgi:hypothetical protein